MNPIINISELDNDLFSISPVNNLKCEINYIDMQNYVNPMTTPASLTRMSYPNLSVNLCSKTINLIKLTFDINKKYNEEQITKYLKSGIINELKNKFIPIILELGNKNRENLKLDSKNDDYFDIIIDKIEKKYNQELPNDKQKKIKNNICSRIISASNYITTKGRYGHPNFYISNYKTHNCINKYIYDINNIKYEIVNSIKENYIILGRKNSIDNNGVHCFIYSDNNKNIIFNKIETPYNITYEMYYSIETIGGSAENQFLVIDTKDISYYRREKIKKINDSIND